LKEKSNGKADCRCDYDITAGVCQDPDYLDSLDDDDVTPPADEEDEINDPDDKCDDGLYYIEKFDLCVYCQSNCAKCSDYWGCDECASGYYVDVIDEDGWYQCLEGEDDGGDDDPDGPVNPDTETAEDCTASQWFDEQQAACKDCMDDCATCAEADVC